MAQRVVLAYSGGLDTSVAVRWMIENYGVEVITVACNLGQEGDWEGLQAQSKQSWWIVASSSPMNSLPLR